MTVTKCQKITILKCQNMETVDEEFPINIQQKYRGLPQLSNKKKNVTFRFDNDAYLLNDGFVETECASEGVEQNKQRKRKLRRLSGIFGDLNTGFMEEYSEEEDYDLEDVENEEENVRILRNRQRTRDEKLVSHEDIIKYYTNKTIQRKHSMLETIFEKPKPQAMTYRRYKRFINFNENNNSKIKRRQSKIKKYNLWKNTQPMSLDYFVRRLEEIERYL
ncbi:uncharacterized protein LOC143204592 [Rhynchophorus ferrugineus]|uniref:uncharacterized protein LOC143204592 n=1 Tax=Rhynchophorus ferrugineus TaxID=354439 RepID=UPI003FCEDB71